MKNKALIFIIILLLSVLIFSLTGCDSSSGKNDKVCLINYRHNGQFTLPVMVDKADTAPDSIRHFKSKMSLVDIYNSISEVDNFQTVLYDNFIVAKDLSYSELGYCIIYPKQIDKFNYIACNMACLFKAIDSEMLLHEILVPMYFVPSLMDDCILIEEKEYVLTASTAEVIEFYKEYGFEIEELQDRIVIKDTIGRSFGDNISFDETVNAFELSIHDNKITFRQI